MALDEFNGATIVRFFTAIAIAFLVPAAALASTSAETRLANGFIDLGMSNTKAVCYSRTIGKTLDRRATARAASIVEAANSSKEVRAGVIKAGGNMVNAFTAAERHCGR